MTEIITGSIAAIAALFLMLFLIMWHDPRDQQSFCNWKPKVRISYVFYYGLKPFTVPACWLTERVE